MLNMLHLQVCKMAGRGRSKKVKPVSANNPVGRPTGFSYAALYDKLAIVVLWQELLCSNPNMPHNKASVTVAAELSITVEKCRKAITDYNKWVKLGYTFTQLDGGWLVQTKRDIEVDDPFLNSKILRKTSSKNIELI